MVVVEAGVTVPVRHSRYAFVALCSRYISGVLFATVMSVLSVIRMLRILILLSLWQWKFSVLVPPLGS